MFTVLEKKKASPHICWQALSIQNISMTGNGSVPWRHGAQAECSSVVLHVFYLQPPNWTNSFTYKAEGMNVQNYKQQEKHLLISAWVTSGKSMIYWLQMDTTGNFLNNFSHMFYMIMFVLIKANAVISFWHTAWICSISVAVPLVQAQILGVFLHLKNLAQSSLIND